MVTPRTGRPRGRPSKSLLDGPDVHTLALAEALQIVWRVPEFTALKVAAAHLEGRPAKPTKTRRRLPPGWEQKAFQLQRPVTGEGIDGRARTLQAKLNTPLTAEEAAAFKKLVQLYIRTLLLARKLNSGGHAPNGLPDFFSKAREDDSV